MTETEQLPIRDDTREAPEQPDLDDYTSYEDDGSLVICDRKNPKAWIRSDTLADVDA